MKRNAVIPLFCLCCFGLTVRAWDDLIEFRGEGTGANYAEARAAAMDDIAVQIGRYMYAFISSDWREQLIYQSKNGKTTDDAEYTGLDTRIFSEMAVSNITIDQEFPQPRQPDGKYKTLLSCLMSQSSLEKQKDQYLRAIVESYAAQLRHSAERGGGLAADVRSWQAVMQTLEKNPMHKAVAYLDIAQGRVNLYDYLAERISALGGGIAFAPIPAQKARRGETITIPIQVSSPLYSQAGQLEYRVSLSRLQGKEAPRVYTAAAIDTSLLPDGVYQGSVELRLEELSPLLRNMVREFTLEVGMPAPPEKPFSLGPLGGQWKGVIEYTAKGQRYRDRYIIAVYDDGTCWAAVAAEDGAAQTGGGTWSADDGVFRLDCAFENPAIARLPGLRWLGLYKLENNNRRLKMNIRPAPDYAGVAGLTLERENKE
jgi:hypothetical protein